MAALSSIYIKAETLEIILSTLKKKRGKGSANNYRNKK